MAAVWYNDGVFEHSGDMEEMKMGKAQNNEDGRDLGGERNGGNQNVETTLLGRMKSLGSDLLVFATAVFLMGGVLLLLVFLFRIGNVGRSVVSAVSDCSPAFAAAAWPILIVVLAVLYRSHVVEVLNSIPFFVKNSSMAQLTGKVSVAPQNVGDEYGTGAEAECRDGMAEKGDAETARETPKDGFRDVNNGENAKCTRNGVSAFVEGALDAIQAEYGKFVYRGANLFSYRDYRFDGAIVDGDCIIGIAVSRGDVDDDRRRLDRIGRFYQAISSRDRKCFRLVYCIPLGQDARVAALREHCRRQGFDFPVIFRPCANGKLQQA